jgi:hypothetical protein
MQVLRKPHPKFVDTFQLLCLFVRLFLDNGCYMYFFFFFQKCCNLEELCEKLQSELDEAYDNIDHLKTEAAKREVGLDQGKHSMSDTTNGK